MHESKEKYTCDGFAESHSLLRIINKEAFATPDQYLSNQNIAADLTYVGSIDLID